MRKKRRIIPKLLDVTELQKRQPEPADVEVRIGLPLGESEEPVSNIVFTRPHPLILPLLPVFPLLSLKEGGQGDRLLNDLG